MAKTVGTASVITHPDIISISSQAEGWSKIRRVDNPLRCIRLEPVLEEYCWFLGIWNGFSGGSGNSIES